MSKGEHYESLLALTGILLLLIAASLVALADNNLCHTVWAGQCETALQWQAGHCYANEAASVCDSIYSDVASQIGGATAQTSGNVAGASSAQSQSQSAQQGQSQQSTYVDPPKPTKVYQTPTAPAPMPTDHPDWVEDCPPDYACAD